MEISITKEKAAIMKTNNSCDNNYCNTTLT